MISIIDSIAIKEIFGLAILIDEEMHLNHYGNAVMLFLSYKNF